MSIASEITRLQGAKSGLATSIAAKGVTVPPTTKLDGYAALVDQITQGASYIVLTSSKKGATLSCGEQTYTLQNDELSHNFQVGLGPVICTASLPGYTSQSITVVVSQPDIYYVALNFSRLPIGLQEVEFIRSSQGRCINLGLLPIATKNFSIKTKFHSLTSSGTLMGWQQSTEITLNNALKLYLPGTNLYIGSFADADRELYLYFNNGEVSGELDSNPLSPITFSGEPPSDGLGFFIFAQSSRGNVYGAADSKFYDFSFDSQTKKLELIPCYTKAAGFIDQYGNNVPVGESGMYDNISGVVYVGMNGGTFIVGPDVN